MWDEDQTDLCGLEGVFVMQEPPNSKLKFQPGRPAFEFQFRITLNSEISCYKVCRFSRSWPAKDMAMKIPVFWAASGRRFERDLEPGRRDYWDGPA